MASGAKAVSPSGRAVNHHCQKDFGGAQPIPSCALMCVIPLNLTSYI